MKAALLVVDVQEAFHDERWGKRNNPDCEANIARLERYWRERDGLILHTRHRSDNPRSPFFVDGPGFAMQEWTAPQGDEALFEKSSSSAFVGTSVHRHLLSQNVHKIVVVGLTASNSVSSTARLGADLGFSVLVVEDATASFSLVDRFGVRYSPEQVHQIALTELYLTFSQIATTQDILERAH